MFSQTNEATPEDVLSIILEGIINMVNGLFGLEKLFILILAQDSSEEENLI